MMRSLAIIIGAASFITVLDVVISSVSIFGFHEVEANRARGAFGEANQTAAILALYTPFAVSLTLIKIKNKIKNLQEIPSYSI